MTKPRHLAPRHLAPYGRLRQLLVASALALTLPGLLGMSASAETVFERVAKTGILNAGTRADAIPFGFRPGNGDLDGLSVDIMRQIANALEVKLGKPVELRLHEVTSSNRIEMVKGARVDIECGITTPTWDRETEVDFSIPFYENGTRVLALRGTARELNDLNGKRIGVVRGSTTAQIVADTVREARIIEVASMEEGLTRLERGEIEGLSNLGLVLRARIESSPLKSKVLMLPRTGALSFEAIACMVPRDDSAWRDLVNHTLAGLLQGVDHYRGGFIELHDRWLGPGGAIYYPLDRSVAERLAAANIWLK